jgi:hypothetical protein
MNVNLDFVLKISFLFQLPMHCARLLLVFVPCDWVNLPSSDEHVWQYLFRSGLKAAK